MAIARGKSTKKQKDREIEIKLLDNSDVLIWVHTKDSDRGYDIIVKQDELLVALIEAGLLSDQKGNTCSI